MPVFSTLFMSFTNIHDRTRTTHSDELPWMNLSHMGEIGNIGKTTLEDKHTSTHIRARQEDIMKHTNPFLPQTKYAQSDYCLYSLAGVFRSPWSSKMEINPTLIFLTHPGHREMLTFSRKLLASLTPAAYSVSFCYFVGCGSLHIQYN